ncbi:IS110 family transposase [Snodgrassella gandavensis]|uniref:IS110 family transposase n=1 Tax=Snodgrassella gandavensis TaxID=2946698 RepID=UPI001EF71B48|nr:transposase [Snodgrassella gandavensis]
MTYVGIDVSKKTLDCCVLDADNEVYLKVQNSRAGYDELMSLLALYDDVHVCLEATGAYWQSLVEFLGANDVCVSVENPAKVHYFAKASMLRMKSDKRDALLIADYCQAMKPRLYSPLDESVAELRLLVGMYHRLRKQRVSERVKLLEVPGLVRHLVESNIAHFDTQLLEVEKMLRAFFRSNVDLGRKHKLLQTIPGIGFSSSAVLLSILASINTFESANQFVAYLGLNPRKMESGTSLKGREHISKVGKPEYRAALYMPAMVAYSKNLYPDFVARLQDNGKMPKVIIVALMRKLAIYAYTVYKTNCAYNVS